MLGAKSPTGGRTITRAVLPPHCSGQRPPNSPVRQRKVRRRTIQRRRKSPLLDGANSGAKSPLHGLIRPVSKTSTTRAAQACRDSSCGSCKIWCDSLGRATHSRVDSPNSAHSVVAMQLNRYWKAYRMRDYGILARMEPGRTMYLLSNFCRAPVIDYIYMAN